MRFSDTFDVLYEQIRRNRVPFLIVFFVTVLLSYGVLYAVDFIPEPVTQTEEEIVEEEAATEEEVVEEVVEVAKPEASLPHTIIFDSLDKEIDVLNPDSRDVTVLDEALLSGVVRHPDSATLTEAGNVFILGHSSYLPNVLNKNFQAFNGIQDLAWGDTIRVQSDDAEYTYRVEKVYKAKASEVVVPLTPGEAKLTLATCNSFGSKDDRFIVEAELIDTKLF